MPDKRPLLSICIPTYNRCEILQRSLKHYFAAPECDDTVEIIVSDNASTDDTQKICERLAADYHNFQYYRNEENVRDENFCIVLDYANGEYIKLMNDSIYMPNDALRLMKQQIIAHHAEHHALFFVTQPVFERIKASEIICNNLDEYVQRVSLFCTAISLFGTWNDDWQEVTEKRRFTHLQLSQVDWTYQIIVKKHGCRLVYLDPYWIPTERAEHKYSQDYSFYKVHLENYSIIKQFYYKDGHLSKRTMRDDDLFFLRHYRKNIAEVLLLRKKGKFDTSNAFTILRQHYYTMPYFYWYIVTLPLWYVGDFVRRLNNKIKRMYFL